MQLSIDIEHHKSTLFLDFLNLLKKDHMIKDFEVLDNKTLLTSYEREVLDDISNLSNSIKDANSGMGRKKDLKIAL